MIFSNMIWPAVYVSGGLVQVWYLILITILIESILIKIFLYQSLGKACKISLIGNVISGVGGIFVMPLLMLFWHLVADHFMPKATFDFYNWIATFIIMCLGSVTMEVWIVKLIWKFKFKKIFVPLLIGNLLTYAVTAILMKNGMIKVGI